MAKEQVKAYIFRGTDSEKELTVFLQDGGVACAYNPDSYYRTNYYQNRITQETTLETIWDELGEGEMYWSDWDGSEEEYPLIDEATTEQQNQIIDDMIAWLYASTGEFEIVKIEMGENITEEFFAQLKAEMVFDEE